jgi:acyl-CoA reductase-like NAD-dependent aldehyde dehydrogenase
MSKIKTINPATGKILATYENVNADEVSMKAKAAREAFTMWKKLDVVESA